MGLNYRLIKQTRVPRIRLRFGCERIMKAAGERPVVGGLCQSRAFCALVDRLRQNGPGERSLDQTGPGEVPAAHSPV